MRESITSFFISETSKNTGIRPLSVTQNSNTGVKIRFFWFSDMKNDLILTYAYQELETIFKPT